MIDTLVTGGSGMLGKDLQKVMGGDIKVIFLTRKHCDLTNQGAVDALFKMLKPKTVIHLAARVGGIEDNIKHPAHYYDENILINTNVLRASQRNDAKKFVAILSSCMYPDVASRYPMTEDMIHESAPAASNFAYGYAKRCMHVQIQAYNKEYGTKYSCLIPANLYGPNDQYFLERSHFVAALIIKIYDALKNGKTYLDLFGTGKPMRQFVYSPDVARIIHEYIKQDFTEDLNIAGPEAHTIQDIAIIALKACNAQNLGLAFDPQKPDGQINKNIDSARLTRLLPAFKFTSLYEGIKKTYEEYCYRKNFK